MDLMQREQLVRRDVQRGRHAAAIFLNLRRLIIRAKTAVQPGIDAGRYAASAGEEGVSDARHARQQQRLQRHAAAPDAAASPCCGALNPGSILMSGCETPSTLNSAPMAPRPVPVNRFKADWISADT